MSSWCIVAGLLFFFSPLSWALAVGEPGTELALRHRTWLEEVKLLISDAERAAFLGLQRGYQRDAFIERFWEVRDPFPETARNELRERWQQRLELARESYPDLDEDRARMLLLNGEPTDAQKILCHDLLKPLEIWFYRHTEQISQSFYLVFLQPAGMSQGRYRLWQPSEGLAPLLAWRPGAAGLPSPTLTLQDDPRLATIRRTCARGDELVNALLSAVRWERLADGQALVPRPGDEWLRTFIAYSTDLPEGAATFRGELRLSFPGRYQSRTVVQGLISVPISEAELGTVGEHRAYEFLLDGEILRHDRLFEHFRYRFQFTPREVGQGDLPLVFQRYLRPGPYQLIVKLEDLNSNRFFRRALTVEVPKPTPRRASAEVAARHTDTATAERIVRDTQRVAVPPTPDPLAEANAAIHTGDHSVKLLPPPGGLRINKVRIEAVVSGKGIDGVTFKLNGKPLFTKRRAPYSVELDLGEAPRVHTVEAIALDSEGNELASDEILLNAGPHRFGVRLIEPREGKLYRSSLQARAVVDVPQGDVLERVEFFLKEDRVASLYQPPFVQPILLNGADEMAYVRAVAYLEDGNSAEDLVFINAPDYVDEIDVQFVELYTSVLDRRGRPVEGLDREDFTVLEEGVPQQIRRFELVRDRPIHAGVILDTSASMEEEIEEAVKGALQFFENVLTSKDRATVITFNETPQLIVRFTNSLEVLSGAVGGLVAEGETALYDSLVYALYYFSGIQGKRAIVLLSDGRDVRSRFSFEDVIEYARHSGVAIYAVGIHMGRKEMDVRARLQRLATETGGDAFFIQRASELEWVYSAIEQELRSQYLLAYQSSRQDRDESFRAVEVQVRDSGFTAKTIRGYYP